MYNIYKSVVYEIIIFTLFSQDGPVVEVLGLCQNFLVSVTVEYLCYVVPLLPCIHPNQYYTD